MNLAKIDTAKTFLVGPILDADGVAKTNEVVGSIKVTKNGTVGAPNGSSTLTHDHTGKYLYVANAADISALGEVEFSLNSGTNAMSIVKFQVVPANIYDSLVLGTDLIDVTTDTDSRNASKATGFATPTNITAGTIATVSGNVNGSVGSVTGSVGSVSADVTTDALSRTASKADVSNLDVAISTRAPASEYDTEMARITAIVATEAKQDIIDTNIDTLISNQGDWATATGFATDTELAKVPKSDSNVTWNVTALASIEGEVDNGINNVLGTPTAGSLGDYVKRSKFMLCNRWDITELNGNSDIFDDSGVSFSAVAAAFTTLAGVTLRKKVI